MVEVCDSAEGAGRPTASHRSGQRKSAAHSNDYFHRPVPSSRTAQPPLRTLLPCPEREGEREGENEEREREGESSTNRPRLWPALAHSLGLGREAFRCRAPNLAEVRRLTGHCYRCPYSERIGLPASAGGLRAHSPHRTSEPPRGLSMAALSRPNVSNVPSPTPGDPSTSAGSRQIASAENSRRRSTAGNSAGNRNGARWGSL